MYVYYNIGEFYKQYNIYMELFISYYRTSKRLKEGTVTISYPLCRKDSQRPNIKKKIKKDFRYYNQIHIVVSITKIRSNLHCNVDLTLKIQCHFNIKAS